MFCQFMTTAIFPETPSIVVASALLLFSVYAARNGIEVIGRLSEFIGPVIMIGILSIAFALSKDMDFKALAPVMEKGFFSLLYGGLYISSLTTEILGLAMVLPYLNDHKKAKTVLISSFLFIVAWFLIITVSVLSTFGPLARGFPFPTFEAVKVINIGDFLDRIEAVHMALWVLGIFIKIAFYLYLTALGIGQLFNLKDYKPLVLPLAAVVLSLGSIIAPSIVELTEFISHEIFTWYALFFILLVPSILLTTAIIRQKGDTGK